MSLKILIVDDEVSRGRRDLLRLVEDLKKQDYVVVTVDDVDAAYDLIWEEKPDLILLDVHFKGTKTDGIQLCKSIRENDDMTPILLITRLLTETEYALQGIRAGADDYIRLGDIEHEEIMIRIWANLPPGVVDIDNYIRIDLIKNQVWKNDGSVWRTVHFRPLEFKLLQILVNNANSPLATTTLKDRLFDHIVSDATLAVYIYRLRKRIEPDPSSPLYVVRDPMKLGYIFEGKVVRSSPPKEYEYSKE